MVTFVLGLCLAVIVFSPETAIGRTLRRLPVEIPAARLPVLSNTQLGFALLVCAGLVALFVFANRDGLIVFGSALGESVAWFAAFDIATYIDVIVLVGLVAAAVRLRASLKAVATIGRRWSTRRLAGLHARLTTARNRKRRARPPVRQPGRTDDEDGPAFAYAGWALAV